MQCRHTLPVSFAPKGENPFSTAHAQLPQFHCSTVQPPLAPLSSSLHCARRSLARSLWQEWAFGQKRACNTTSMRSNSVMRTSWARVGAQGRSSRQWAAVGGRWVAVPEVSRKIASKPKVRAPDWATYELHHQNKHQRRALESNNFYRVPKTSQNVTCPSAKTSRSVVGVL